MADKFFGSICFSDLMAAAKSGHSAFSRAKNGKVYFNADVWINEKADKFGNNLSIVLRSKKEHFQREGKVYIGNFKFSDPDAGSKKSRPSSQNDSFQGYSDGLPF